MDAIDKWRASAQAAPPLDPPTRDVRLIEIDVPFFAIVRFMVKWSFASIPAAIILLLCTVAGYALIGALGIALLRP